MSRVEEALLRLELMSFEDRYVAILDDDRLEEWPGLFTETCRYEIIARENEEGGFPAPLVYCDNARMLRDRVVSLRKANIYERPAYRHLLSGLACKQIDDRTIKVTCNYVVVNTSFRGESQIYQAGKYFDVVVDSALVGVEKPDPAIFRPALEALDVTAAEAVYVGDLYEVDVVGAQAAGLEAVLLDPDGDRRSAPCRAVASLSALADLLLQGDF